MFILQTNLFDPIHDVIGGQGKRGTKFIIRQRNGLKMCTQSIHKVHAHTKYMHTQSTRTHKVQTLAHTQSTCTHL